jgi:hypothetical protein
LVVLFFAQSAASGVHPFHRAQQALHMMSHFVCDYVSLGEVSGCAETRFQFPKERKIDIDFLITRTIEGPNRRACDSTGGARLLGKQLQRWFTVLSPGLTKDIVPNILGASQHNGNELLLFFLLRVSWS